MATARLAHLDRQFSAAADRTAPRSTTLQVNPTCISKLNQIVGHGGWRKALGTCTLNYRHECYFAELDHGEHSGRSRGAPGERLREIDTLIDR